MNVQISPVIVIIISYIVSYYLSLAVAMATSFEYKKSNILLHLILLPLTMTLHFMVERNGRQNEWEVFFFPLWFPILVLRDLLRLGLASVGFTLMIASYIVQWVVAVIHPQNDMISSLFWALRRANMEVINAEEFLALQEKYNDLAALNIVMQQDIDQQKRSNAFMKKVVEAASQQQVPLDSKVLALMDVNPPVDTTPRAVVTGQLNRLPHPDKRPTLRG